MTLIDRPVGGPQRDVDVSETQEWLEALEAVVRHDGPRRAAGAAGARARWRRAAGASTRRPASPRRTSTRSAAGRREPPTCPATRRSSGASARYVRWNAIAMVLQANAESSELGGHIASYQSAATLYEVGFNHFWHAPSRRPRRRPRLHPGPLVAGHLRARVPRGPPDRGAAAAASARRSTRGGSALLPAPVADAGLLAVPDGVDGPRAADGDLPGALHEVPDGPRDPRHDGPQGLGVHGRRRDGRARVDRRDLARRPRAPRQPRLRRQLQPAAPRRPGPRQRQDHPGARDGLPRRGLERHQGHLGLALGPAARQADRDGVLRAPDGGGARRRLPDLQVARRRLRARALLRHLARSSRAMVADWTDEEIWRSTAAATTRARSTPPTPRRSRTPASRR